MAVNLQMIFRMVPERELQQSNRMMSTAEIIILDNARFEFILSRQSTSALCRKPKLIYGI